MSFTKTSRTSPGEIPAKEYTHAEFGNGEFAEKRTGKLPAMGWNSWNAFGSGNTEALTRQMADKIVELGLDKLGYEYLVLDDGCYKPERVNGRLSNEEVKFPSGFRALADYIHSKGLKFGMYNDIGTNLCAGAAVGTCGFEDVDARSYVDWDVDFLKIDNCYYLWDNATFSNAENAKYTYAPNIRSIRIVSPSGAEKEYNAVEDGVLLGRGVIKTDKDYVTNIGTFDGTNVGNTPVGDQSGELAFEVNTGEAGEYMVYITYATGKEAGTGEWLQIAVGEEDNEQRFFDGMLEETAGLDVFAESDGIKVIFNKGKNILRLMNHRRQENTLMSYAAMFYALLEADSDKDIVLSLCEWGKTQPQNWGHKMGNSWRILNDISFCVGADGDPGKGSWTDPGTPSITSQYDKAVVMDEFAGLDKGWNDPDMMVIGMNGVDDTMARTHMAMWCMMNSPLMLGMDLRRVEKGDSIWKIIANEGLIALNQDSLGIQAKRIYCSIEEENPDTEYITNHERVDILAKPLGNGDIAISFINLSDTDDEREYSVSMDRILDFIGYKCTDTEAFKAADKYEVQDLWSGKTEIVTDGIFKVSKLAAHDNHTIRISVRK